MYNRPPIPPRRVPPPNPRPWQSPPPGGPPPGAPPPGGPLGPRPSRTVDTWSIIAIASVPIGIAFLPCLWAPVAAICGLIGLVRTIQERERYSGTWLAAIGLAWGVGWMIWWGYSLNQLGKQLQQATQPLQDSSASSTSAAPSSAASTPTPRTADNLFRADVGLRVLKSEAPGPRYRVLTVEVTNRGAGQLYVSEDDFKAIGSNRQVYTSLERSSDFLRFGPSSDETAYGRNLDYIHGQLLPGGVAQGEIAFFVDDGIQLTQVGMKPE